jgi:D-alanyl-D-alanine carboxypeptidase
MSEMSRRSFLCSAAIASATLAARTAPSRAATAAPLTGRFQEVLESLRAQFKLPGITAAYVLADGSSAMAAAGHDDVQTKTFLTPQSRMMSGSVGKTFVAAAALKLVLGARLDLDAPVSGWLEDRAWFQRLPNSKQITLRHLLTHSSGLIDHSYTKGWQGAIGARSVPPATPMTAEESIGYILDQPALFQPGKGYAYTDTGYLLVGLIIEKSSGERYYGLIKREFLDPLALTLTIPSDRPDLPGLAQGYPDQTGEFTLPATTEEIPGVLRWNPSSEWTGGGLATNPHDLARWAKALYEGRAMQGGYVAQLLQAVPVGPQEPDRSYGLGVMIWNSPEGRAYGHSGWFPGYKSEMVYYPGSKIALAFQTNTDVAAPNSKPMTHIRSRLTRTLMR